jgi:ferredoxin--NADP+ reductase
MSKYKVAIVGAGPSGFFAAQALQNSQTDDLKFEIDMIERLPTPWGLVRSGVAPDHPKIKTVSKVFEKIAAEPGFRFLGNIDLGKDITIENLRDRYDAVVLATGSGLGRKLGIPGEELRGSLSAADFVPWYNGHPDYVNVDVPLDGKVAVIIGAGNVAMDCGRILAINPEELDSTDTAPHALAALHKSSIREVHIAARRGAEHAAFTAPELRDLPKLEHTDVHLNADEVAQALARASALGEPEKEVRNNLEAMRIIAENPLAGRDRSLHLQFLLAPKEIVGSERVEGITFSINRVDGEKVVDTGETLTISCQLVISAIGYTAEPLASVPEDKGKIKNIDGRVEGNMYVVGWAKRGPSGVVGTNKSDAADVIKLLIEDLNSPKNSQGIEDLLPAGHVVVDQEKWLRINASEVAAGEALGKPRLKEVSREKLLSLGEA